MFKKSPFCLALLLGAIALGCGSSNSPTDAGSQQDDGGSVDAGATDAGTTDAGTSPVITIQNFTYTPLDITVAPGTFIGVVNKDAAPHSVTSESAMGQYTPGGVAGVSFDTGLLSQGQMVTISIPANAPSGTVVPYYCSKHTSGMPQGTITIRSFNGG